uniref:Uncharacterized protein n=1 Tax=Phlebotomus papatasi TaxID=29031 RepID=A0A1B0DBH0_PHLPP
MRRTCFLETATLALPKWPDKAPNKTPKKKHEKSKEVKKSPKESPEDKKKNTPKKSHQEKPKEEKKSPKEAEKAGKSPRKPKEEPKAAEEAPAEDKKKLAGILYQKFKNRSSCINPGSKEVPEGAPNCLAGLSFIITGILESLQREEATQLIKDLGGKVVGSISKKTDYVVLGEEAGPAKLKKVEEFGTKKLSEDGLFDLIREKSAGKLPKSPSVAAVKRKAEKAQEEDAKREKKEEVPVKSQLNVVGNVSGKLPWVDKYAPATSKQIIGQQGAASNLVKLTNWLSKWYSNHDGKKKLQRPSPWAKSDDGAFFKAALLSGPPGVGKTTTNHSKEQSKRRRIIDSDDEESPKDAKPNLKKLKKEPEVPKKIVKSFSEMYSDKPVDMVFKKQKTPKKSEEVLFESDEEFEKIAAQLDCSDGKATKSKTPKKSAAKEGRSHKTPKKELDEADFHSDNEFMKTVKALDVPNGNVNVPSYL